MSIITVAVIFLLNQASSSAAFSCRVPGSRHLLLDQPLLDYPIRPPTRLQLELKHEDGDDNDACRRDITTIPRRSFVGTAAIILVGTTAHTPNQVAHATRAVGGAEEECRAAGNCLERGELDGALGWSWGAKDRCDARDPRCGADGKLISEENVMTLSVPSNPQGFAITHVAELSLSIGRNEQAVLRLGLYGNDATASVVQFLRFVSRRGLATTSELAFENGMGVEAVPVSLTRGGTLGQVVPLQRLDFGVPLQSMAYARSKGLAKAGENFVPQPRPKPLNDVPVLRKHDAAGLVSIPSKGLGYGGTGFESEDECYEAAFAITADAVPAMDKENRRVIGQVLDSESMATLARLASLPTKKGFRGVIPGQISGPPLLRVALTDVEVESEKEANTAVASL